MSPIDDAPEGVSPKRAATRVRLKADIQVRKSGYHKTGVILHDVSNTGCRIELPERVVPDEIVWVTFPGLQPIEARVAWAENWIAGLKFVNPIHPAVFETLLPRMKP